MEIHFPHPTIWTFLKNEPSVYKIRLINSISVWLVKIRLCKGHTALYDSSQNPQILARLLVANDFIQSQCLTVSSNSMQALAASWFCDEWKTAIGVSTREGSRELYFGAKFLIIFSKQTKQFGNNSRGQHKAKEQSSQIFLSDTLLMVLNTNTIEKTLNLMQWECSMFQQQSRLVLYCTYAVESQNLFN